MVEQLLSLRLPQVTELEIVVGRLPDGTIVARAAHEVKPKPGAEAPPQPPPTPGR